MKVSRSQLLYYIQQKIFFRRSFFLEDSRLVRIAVPCAQTRVAIEMHYRTNGAKRFERLAQQATESRAKQEMRSVLRQSLEIDSTERNCSGWVRATYSTAREMRFFSTMNNSCILAIIPWLWLISCPAPPTQKGRRGLVKRVALPCPHIENHTWPIRLH